MEIKQLERAKNLYEDILQLDKELIELEKYANELVNEKSECKITLEFNKVKEKSKVKFDEDGSIVFENDNNSNYRGMFSLVWGGTSITKNEEPKDTIKIEHNLVLTIKLISVLMDEKQQKRRIFIERLSKLGIKI